MKAKQAPLVLSALVAALISSSSALAVTQVEAHAQLDQIAATQSRAAAHEVLHSLVLSGVPVDRALAVVSDAVNQNVDAGELHKMGSQIRARVEQNVSVEQAYAQVKSEFTGNATAIGATRTVTTEGSQAARPDDASGSAQAPVKIRSQNSQHGVISANPGAAPVTGAPPAAVTPAMAMNPALSRVPGGTANPGVSGTPGAAGNARFDGQHR
jgi:hypothetical protein